MKLDLLPYETLGRFLGVTELVEKGLLTPEQFLARCIEIAKEYQQAKEKKS